MQARTSLPHRRGFTLTELLTVVGLITVLVSLLLVSGTQFTLFAMWFDQEANKELR